MEKNTADYEKNYKSYESIPTPRVIDVSLDIDLYPKTRNIRGEGKYQLLNKAKLPIDSIIVDHNRMTEEISLDRANHFVFDSIHRLKVFYLEEALQPGDTMQLTFKIENWPNNILRYATPVRKNGTFFTNSNFPAIGYESRMELTDDKTRTKYGLDRKERMQPPTDTVARMNNYISTDADWISFEAKIGTSEDQIAMAPGKLQREWNENGRRYFHYKMQSKMVHFYNIISAKYEIYEDEWEGIPIRIFHHKGHDANLERLAKGAKAGFAYCSTNFAPYQHDQLRILEFPVTAGTYAQSFANTVPFSEGAGFMADVDDSKEVGVDYPFSISAHEVAHQWWAHQVIGGRVQGATVMSESLSEYVSPM